MLSQLRICIFEQLCTCGLILVTGEYLYAGQIFAADCHIASADVLAECTAHCCAAVCGADHRNWSYAIWWVGGWAMLPSGKYNNIT